MTRGPIAFMALSPQLSSRWGWRPDQVQKWGPWLCMEMPFALCMSALCQETFVPSPALPALWPAACGHPRVSSLIPPTPAAPDTQLEFTSKLHTLAVHSSPFLKWNHFFSFYRQRPSKLTFSEFTPEHHHLPLRNHSLSIALIQVCMCRAQTC